MEYIESDLITSPAERLGNPDFCIGGFELWILARQFPESDDYWNGNWLYVIARCTANSSVVQTAGTILHLTELHKLMVECKQIYVTLSGEAHLDCMEPNIDLKIKMKSLGHCELIVSITPDHLYEEHSFIFDLDQSYLPPLLNSLEIILQSYFIKGLRDQPIHTSNGVNSKRIVKRLFEVVQFRIKKIISWLLVN